jgi:hypothetical protein
VRKAEHLWPVRVNFAAMRTAFPMRRAARAVVAVVLLVVLCLAGCTRRPAAHSAPAASGYIDEGTDSKKIIGWAWDKTQPDAAVTVEIYDGTVRIGTVPADAFRQDLLNAGVGNGKHGFEFRMPARVRDGAIHQIRVKIAGTDKFLEGSPKKIQYTRR